MRTTLDRQSTAAPSAATAALKAAVRPLTGDAADFTPLLERIGRARFVLIGEASHGTHEFYRIRAEITKRLIRERGFTAVAMEADWPDAHRIDRYVRGGAEDRDATEALEGFHRFPQWMWRNADVLDFVGWLRAHNDSTGDAPKVGVYGLDLYSLHSSMAAVLRYLRAVDPPAAERASRRYACFDQFGPDPQAYGYASGFGLAPSCEDEVVGQLRDLNRAALDYVRRDGWRAEDDLFYAEQNARVVANAEAYYRAMFRGRVESWNLRDRHMAETLEQLTQFLSRWHDRAKVVVWAHNSHLGDARATEMGAGGELNVGQLVRQRHGDESFLVGFTTDNGTVTAASDWDAPAERMRVRLALPDSYEALFHDLAVPNFLLDLAAGGEAVEMLRAPRLERAIGVVYRPETERLSHYFHASLPDQFDAVLHYDTTRALEPLERTGTWERGELPETYPTAL